MRQGLLGTSLWVSPAAVSLEEGAPPFVSARILKLDEDRVEIDIERDLFEVLAQERLRSVKVVKVRSATARREIDAEQDRIADLVFEYIGHSLPMVEPGQNVSDQSTEVTLVTLICAPTEFQVSQRVEWAADDPGLIIVASPEDRSSPWSGDAFVRDNNRFVGFVLMHIVTVAGLWNGVTTGTFDTFNRDASTHHSIWISRVFVNAVLMEGFARRVAATVVREAGDGASSVVDWKSSVPPVGTHFITEGNIDHHVSLLVDGVFSLENRTLDFALGESFAPRRARRIGIVTQLGAFLHFAGDKIIRMPHWAFRWFVGLFSRRLTTALHGEDGNAVVGPNLEEFDFRDRVLIELHSRVTEREEHARTESSGHSLAGSVRSTPRLWTRLRELIFGAIDGSADLSAHGFAPTEETVPVFARLTDVLSSDRSGWKIAGETRPANFPSTVGYEQIDEIPELLASLRAWVAEAEEAESARAAEIVELDAQIAEAESELASVTFDLSEADLVELDENGAAVLVKGKRLPARKAGDSAPDFVALRKAFALAPKAIAGLYRRQEAVEGVRQSFERESRDRSVQLAAFEQWIEERARTFHWQVITRMRKTRDRVKQELDSVESSIDALSLPSPASLIALRKNFHAFMLISTGIIALAATVVALIPVSHPQLPEQLPWYPEPWQTIAIALGVLLVATVIGLVAYYRGWSEFERRTQLAIDRLAWAEDAAQIYRVELARLQSLHAQTNEWFTLLARVLHAPWKVPEEWLGGSNRDVDPASLPFAMKLAQSRDDDPAATSRIHRAAAQHLLVKGWRDRAFRSLLRNLGAELGYDASGLGLEALDSDVPHASNHSRRILSEHADSDVILERVAAEYVAEIVASVQQTSLSQARPTVQRILSDPLALDRRTVLPNSQEGTPWDEFLMESLTGNSNPMTPIGSLGFATAELQKGYHEKVNSYVVMPERLDDPTLAERSGDRLHVIPFEDDDVRPLDVAIRIDIAGPIPVSAARLWEQAAASAAPSQPAATEADRAWRTSEL
jgi:hypothetical protein